MLRRSTQESIRPFISLATPMANKSLSRTSTGAVSPILLVKKKCLLLLLWEIEFLLKNKWPTVQLNFGGKSVDLGHLFFNPLALYTLLKAWRVALNTRICGRYSALRYLFQRFFHSAYSGPLPDKGQLSHRLQLHGKYRDVHPVSSNPEGCLDVIGLCIVVFARYWEIKVAGGTQPYSKRDGLFLWSPMFRRGNTKTASSDRRVISRPVQDDCYTCLVSLGLFIPWFLWEFFRQSFAAKFPSEHWSHAKH